jgi:hypothetical protein
MAAPVVESSATGGTNGSTLTLNKPTGTQEGDVLVAWIVGQSTTSAPSGWTVIDSVDFNESPLSDSLTTLYKVAGASEPSSYDFSQSGGIGGIVRVSGADTTTPINASAIPSVTRPKNNFIQTVFTTGSVTTTEDDCLILRLGWANSALGTTWTSATSVVDADPSTGAGGILFAGEEDQASAGASGASGGDFASANAFYMWATIAIAPGAAGPATPVIEGSSTSTGGVFFAGANIETFDISKPTGTQEGDLLVIVVGDDEDGDVVLTSSGWTEAASYRDTSYDTNFHVLWKVAGASEPSSYTFDFNFIGSRQYYAVLFRISGVDTSNPINATDTDISSTLNGDITVSLTTTVDNCLILTGVHQGASAPYNSRPAGFTEEYFNDEWGSSKLVVLSGSKATAGSTGNLEWDSASGSQASGFAVAIAPGAGGGPATITSTGAVTTGAVTASGSGDVTLEPGSSEGSVTTPAVEALGYGTVLQATGGSGSVDYNTGTHSVEQADAAAATYTGLDLGDSTHDDLYMWVWCEGAVGSGGTTYTSVTVAGNPATKLAEVTSSFRGSIALYKIAHPGTSTGTVVATFGAGVLRQGVFCVSASGVDSEDIDTGRDTGTVPTLTVDAKDGGVVFGGEYGSSGNAGNMNLTTTDVSFASGSTFRLEHSNISADDATYDVSPAEQSTEERCFIVIALNPGAAGPDVATAGNVVLPAATVSGTASVGGAGVSGTLTVQEAGSDDFTASGSVEVSGALAAQEVGADDLSGTGTVVWPDITGSLAVQEAGEDTLAASGTVAWPEITGTLSAQEAGSDTASGAGAVEVTGTLAAQEVGTDTLSATGSVSFVEIAGTLAAQEAGDDTLSGTGAIEVSGALSAQESGQDTLSASGTVVWPEIDGFLSVQEVGGDTSSISGTVSVSGSLAAQESGADNFSGSGLIDYVGIAGALNVREVGEDSFAASGAVPVSGSLAAQEAGEDSLSASGAVAWPEISGSLAVREAEGDTHSGVGAVLVSGALGAQEAGPDTFVGSGSTVGDTSGTLAAQETGADTAAGQGAVIITGAFGVQEAGSDALDAAGGPIAAGAMAVSETGADGFSGTGVVVWPGTTGAMSIQEVRDDDFSGAGAVIVTGDLGASDAGSDTASGTGAVIVLGVLAAQEAGADIMAAYTVPLSARRAETPQNAANGGSIVDAGNGGTVLRQVNGGTVVSQPNGGTVRKG